MMTFDEFCDYNGISDRHEFQVFAYEELGERDSIDEDAWWDALETFWDYADVSDLAATQARAIPG